MTASTLYSITEIEQETGISRDTLRYRIEKHGLARPERS